MKIHTVVENCKYSRKHKNRISCNIWFNFYVRTSSFLFAESANLYQPPNCYSMLIRYIFAIYLCITVQQAEEAICTLYFTFPPPISSTTAHAKLSKINSRFSYRYPSLLFYLPTYPALPRAAKFIINAHANSEVSGFSSW